MNKLYNKSELAFSIILIVVYIVGASLCDYFSSIIKINKVLTLPFMLALSLLLFFWIKKNNLQKKYGLCKPCFRATRFLFYIPLLILISTNLWFGVALNYGWLESLLGVFTMLCVGFVEEIILLEMICFKYTKKGLVKIAETIIQAKS